MTALLSSKQYGSPKAVKLSKRDGVEEAEDRSRAERMARGPGAKAIAHGGAIRGQERVGHAAVLRE